MLRNSGFEISELVVGSGEQDIDTFCSPVLLWIKNWEKVGFIISELVFGYGGQGACYDVWIL